MQYKDTKFHGKRQLIFPDLSIYNNKDMDATGDLFQFYNGHSRLALAVSAEAEALDGLVFPQRLLDGLPQGARAFAVDDRHGMKFTHDGGVSLPFHHRYGLQRLHAAQVELRGDRRLSEGGIPR